MTVEEKAREYANDYFEERLSNAGAHSGFIAGAKWMASEREKEIAAVKAERDAFDQELDIVHNCLADLYEHQFNSERDRIAHINKALKRIEKLKHRDNEQ